MSVTKVGCYRYVLSLPKKDPYLLSIKIELVAQCLKWFLLNNFIPPLPSLTISSFPNLANATVTHHQLKLTLMVFTLTFHSGMSAKSNNHAVLYSY
jgi:hypothetical protein